MPFPSLTRTTSQLQSVALTLLPHGGQGTARRNAWSAMSADAATARSRREADFAMERAVLRASQTETYAAR